MRFFAGLIVGMMVLASVAGIVSGAEEDDTCAVLFDFGNGQVMWADVPVSEGMNAFDALVNATDKLGLDLVYKDGEHGIWVESIGGPGANIANHWWGFLTWDDAEDSWAPASAGVLDISIDSGDAIAFSSTSFSSWTPDVPAVTPNHRYSWTSFRHDVLNSGMQGMVSIKLSDLKWSIGLEKGFISSSVVGANGLVYIFDGGDMFDDNASSALYCLNMDGEIVWKNIIESGYQITSPLLHNSTAIVSTADGYVRAFDATIGSLMWEFDAESRTVGFDNGITSSPAAYLGDIIVATSNGTLISINATSGVRNWNVSVGAKIYSSSPAMYNDIIYIGDEAGHVLAYDAGSGEEVWSNSAGAGGIRASPLIDAAKGQVVVTSNAKGTEEGKITALNLTDGEMIWQTAIGGTSASAALSSKGYVIATATDVILVDFDGKKLWSYDLGETFGGGAPTIIGDKIFTVTNEESSRLICVDLNGKLSKEVTLEPAQWTLCSPTFIDGLLFVTSNNGHVYAFSIVEDNGDEGNNNPWFLIGGIAGIVLIAAIGLVYWNGKRKGE